MQMLKMGRLSTKKLKPLKRIICAVIYFYTIALCSQELVKSVPLVLDKKANVRRIVEQEKKQVSLFITEKSKFRWIRFDEQFSIKDSISGARPADQYDDVIGYGWSNDNYYAYWSNSKSTKILVQTFNFNTKKVTENPFSISFEKEKIISSLTIEGVFCIVSIVKNTSILHFYTFKDGELNKKVVDLTNKRFLDEENKSVSLWNLIAIPTGFEPNFSFQTIYPEDPPSIVTNANKRKLYVFGNSLLFSIDTNKKFTQTFTINLSDFSISQKVYTQPYFDEKIPTADDPQFLDMSGSSNSFISKNHVVQIRTIGRLTKISAKNREGDELKSFKISEFEEINFKNSELYQESGSYKNLKTLEDSNQFSRKMNGLNCSLSLFESVDKLGMVVGGVSVLSENNDAIMVGGLAGGLAGALVAAAIAPNEPINNSSYYYYRKVVYFNCLLDKNFNPVAGDLSKTSYDKLREFVEKDRILNKQVNFKIDSTLFFGGYNREQNNYSFYKFSN